ncbi:MAG TPA: phenylalanine--tRNA ligase subunit beta [Stellaceae bacterium]|nr:phenylalanine--tRNA ligase subunit beta [Stellaceae bacterium]HYL48952.1 phenylalanine--tRNA ligase subunit beta [Stellaceae bacterium]
MKTTLAWLKAHLETSAALDAIVGKLVMLGLEVESVVDRSKPLAPFVVARVLEAKPHPDADKLKLCLVDTGHAKVEVVCGAPNARAGMLGVFAPTGAVIPRSGQALKASKIRGVMSNGMLCSGYELMLSDDHTGIIELPEGARPGESFVKAAGLDDPVLDVKVTPNRADCLSVRGLARDLAAAGMGKLAPLDAAPVSGTFPCPIAVHLAGPDDKACPLFLGRVVRGLKNGPSPASLQERLSSIGLRPISALVDITNLLTFDLGRPLHVFDADKLSGDLAVRGARSGESLAALNGKTYALEPDMTVIADGSGVLSLGGVIGGAASGCTETTTSVFIEAALFDPMRTAATGRKLNVQSDARYRFERGLDPEFVGPGLEIATRLILELCGGTASEVGVSGTVPQWRRTIRFRPDRVRSLGGVEVAASEQRRILQALGCVVRETGDHFDVELPSWRADIEGEACLVEEVLRIHGYEAIPAVSLPRDGAVPPPALTPVQRRAGMVRRTLAAHGLVEAVSFSFLALKDAALFGGGAANLMLLNPISADLDAMRPSILPNLLAAARRNADRGLADVALFELGPQYRDDAENGQDLVATGIRAGAVRRKSWNESPRTASAFDAKADALVALAAAGVAAEAVQLEASAPVWYHPGRAGTLRQGPKVLATFGEIHPGVLRSMAVEGPVAGFEVFLDAVPEPRTKGAARPLLKLSPYQPVSRDFAFVVDAAVPAEALLRAARGVDRKLVSDVRLFDLYQGKGLPDGKKSLAISVTLQPTEATLTDAEIEGFSAKLIAAVEKATGGSLRK